MQALDHLLAGTHVRRGGQGDARNMREMLGELAQLQVFRTEVVAPLGHAVRLVDGEQADVQLLQETQHARLHQTLGRQVEQLDLATTQAIGDVPLGFRAQRGIQCGGRNAQLVEGGDLVFHQRDQRRNHHRQPLAQQRRDLEAQRLATAGGHQHQSIAAAGHALDDPRLIATEGVVTENVFEDALGLVEHGGLRIEAAHYTQAHRSASVSRRGWRWKCTECVWNGAFGGMPLFPHPCPLPEGEGVECQTRQRHLAVPSPSGRGSG
ncbi:hypothetical protein D9M71_521280 [compost metagenome]